MRTPRWNHRAVRLNDGRVMVLGGASTASEDEWVQSSAEIFDPEKNTWTEISPMRNERRATGATLLNDGRVLVVGGKRGPGAKSRELSEVEIYDPVAQTWTDAAPLAEGRWGPSVTVLRNGQVLVVGGMYGQIGRRKSAELFDPIKEVWSDAGKLRTARNGHRAIMLADGSVLIVGGFLGTRYLSSCEVYVPRYSGLTARTDKFN